MRVFFVFVLDDRCRGDEIAWSPLKPFYSLEAADDEAYWIAMREVDMYDFSTDSLGVYALKPNAVRYFIRGTTFSVLIRQIEV
jgi:hypothetical protein